MGLAYEAVGLRRHPKKMVRRAFHSTLWGAEVDGVGGTARAPVPRAMAFGALCAEVAALGLATPALLSCLAGSLVAVMLFRRRMLSLLD